MDFREKVRRLVGTRNKSELSREAGLPVTALDAVVNKGREPLASNAVRLARVLGVPCGWLFNDAAEWPPPPPTGGVAEIGDVQLVDELARRRRLVIQDVQSLAKRFGDQRSKEQLEGWAKRLWAGEPPPLSHEERSAFLAAFMDLQRLASLSNRLQFLNPETVHPSGDVPSVERILVDCPTIRTMLTQQLLAEPDATKTIMSEYTPGRLTPVAFGDGDVIDRQRYIELGCILQRHFVPLIDDPENGAPTDRPVLFQQGQRLPERFREFVRFDAASGQAFAYRVRDRHMEPAIPVGSIVICQPGEPGRTGKHPCLLVYDDPRKTVVRYWRQTKMTVSDLDKIKPRRLRVGDLPAFYPVIAGPFPAPTTAVDVSRRRGRRRTK